MNDILISYLVFYHSSLASLVILKQPFPQVISKNKQLPEEQLQVQLLTASNVQFQSVSQVKAALLVSEQFFSSLVADLFSPSIL